MVNTFCRCFSVSNGSRNLAVNSSKVFFSASFFLLFGFFQTPSFFCLANFLRRYRFHTQVRKRTYRTRFQIVFLGDGIFNLITIDKFFVA